MFAELDKTTVISAEKQDVSLITNMPINDSFFEEHARFFSSIGYIALQIAQIEDEIRQSMIAMTGDWDAVDSQTKGKNLGALLSRNGPRTTRAGQTEGLLGPALSCPEGDDDGTAEGRNEAVGLDV